MTIQGISFNDNETWTNLLDILYPIGTIYLSYVDVSPASSFGGIWAQITDKMIRVDNNIATKTGDTHQISDTEMPSHSHSVTAHSHTLNGHYHNYSHYHKYDLHVAGSGYGAEPNTNVNNPSYGIIAVTGQTGVTTFGSSYMTYSYTGNVEEKAGYNSNSTGSGEGYSLLPYCQNVYCWERTG